MDFSIIFPELFFFYGFGNVFCIELPGEGRVGNMGEL
jgi:hypothetical protein